MTTPTKTVIFVLQLVETIKILRKELVDKILEIKIKDQDFNQENGDQSGKSSHHSEIANLNKQISDLKESNAQLSTKLVNSEKNVAILKEEMTKIVQMEKGNGHNSNTAKLEIEKLKEEILNLKKTAKIDTSESQQIAKQSEGEYEEISELFIESVEVLAKKNQEISRKFKMIANEVQYIHQYSKTFSSGSFFSCPADLDRN